jgi:hypothetical protein
MPLIAMPLIAMQLMAMQLMDLQPITGIVPAGEFVWLLPLCCAIALVSAASHRDDIREIVRHAARGAAILIVGLLAFMVTISFTFEWALP